VKVSVSDGKSRALPSRLKMCSEYLVLQREEFTIWDDEDSYPVEAGLRYRITSPSGTMRTAIPWRPASGTVLLHLLGR
jgi:hypothetical protein